MFRRVHRVVREIGRGLNEHDSRMQFDVCYVSSDADSDSFVWYTVYRLDDLMFVSIVCHVTFPVR